jgi:hypothetical protein
MYKRINYRESAHVHAYKTPAIPVRVCDAAQSLLCSLAGAKHDAVVGLIYISLDIFRNPLVAKQSDIHV